MQVSKNSTVSEKNELEDEPSTGPSTKVSEASALSRPSDPVPNTTTTGGKTGTNESPYGTKERKAGASKALTAMSFNLVTGKARGQKSDEDLSGMIASQNRDTPFRIEDLKKAWSKYASTLDPKKKSLLREQLNFYYPKVTDDPSVFTVMVDSDAVRKQIEDEYPALRRFVADELQNDLFRIDIKAEHRDEAMLPQSPGDKLKYLSEKSSNFKKIVQELGLTALH